MQSIVVVANGPSVQCGLDRRRSRPGRRYRINSTAFRLDAITDRGWPTCVRTKLTAAAAAAAAAAALRRRIAVFAGRGCSQPPLRRFINSAMRSATTYSDERRLQLPTRFSRRCRRRSLRHHAFNPFEARYNYSSRHLYGVAFTLTWGNDFIMSTVDAVAML